MTRLTDTKVMTVKELNWRLQNPYLGKSTKGKYELLIIKP